MVVISTLPHTTHVHRIESQARAESLRGPGSSDRDLTWSMLDDHRPIGRGTVMAVEVVSFRFVNILQCYKYPVGVPPKSELHSLCSIEASLLFGWAWARSLESF